MFVRHHASFAGDVSEDDRHKRLGADIVDYHRAGLAAVTIDQCRHLHLVMERALFRRTLEVADKGFVHLDNAAARTERDGRAPSELQSLMRISYAVFCLKKKNRRYTTR